MSARKINPDLIGWLVAIVVAAMLSHCFGTGRSIALLATAVVFGLPMMAFFWGCYQFACLVFGGDQGAKSFGVGILAVLLFLLALCVAADPVMTPALDWWVEQLRRNGVEVIQ